MVRGLLWKVSYSALFYFCSWFLLVANDAFAYVNAPGLTYVDPEVHNSFYKIEGVSNYLSTYVSTLTVYDKDVNNDTNNTIICVTCHIRQLQPGDMADNVHSWKRTDGVDGYFYSFGGATEWKPFISLGEKENLVYYYGVVGRREDGGKYWTYFPLEDYLLKFWYLPADKETAWSKNYNIIPAYDGYASYYDAVKDAFSNMQGIITDSPFYAALSDKVLWTGNDYAKVRKTLEESYDQDKGGIPDRIEWGRFTSRINPLDDKDASLKTEIGNLGRLESQPSLKVEVEELPDIDDGDFIQKTVTDSKNKAVELREKLAFLPLDPSKHGEGAVRGHIQKTFSHSFTIPGFESSPIPINIDLDFTRYEDWFKIIRNIILVVIIGLFLKYCYDSIFNPSKGTDV